MRIRGVSLAGLLLRGLATAVLLIPEAPVLAQPAAPPPSAPEAPPGGQAAQRFNPEQLDAMLAPIALYPDTLLTQVLMAAGFPLEIVQAQRWVDDPAHKSLTGDALANALQAEPWDPSVKSLVPFPQVLNTMSQNLDWTQQLGYAMATQQADVMDSVQRLRRQAQVAGTLASTPQQTVTTSEQAIVIQPANPGVVYVPTYNPTVVYGGWPYPAYPPVYYPPPVGYPVLSGLATGLAFGAGAAIVGSLWGVGSANWGGNNVNVNVNRYNNINASRINANRATAMRSNTWQPRVNSVRGGAVAGPVGRPAPRQGLPANAIGRESVRVPANAVNRPAARPGGAAPGAAGRTPGGGGAGASPGAGQRPSPQAQRPAQAQGSAPRQNAFSGMGDGRNASAFSNRGSQSRQSMQRGGRSGGGARGGGGGRRR
jgi:uncharacterized membrane protein YgcG